MGNGLINVRRFEISFFINIEKYCKFKAIDIMKSLKNGEVPKRGGPNDKIVPKPKPEDSEIQKELNQIQGQLEQNNLNGLNNNVVMNPNLNISPYNSSPNQYNQVQNPYGNQGSNLTNLGMRNMNLENPNSYPVQQKFEDHTNPNNYHENFSNNNVAPQNQDLHFTFNKLSKEENQINQVNNNKNINNQIKNNQNNYKDSNNSNNSKMDTVNQKSCLQKSEVGNNNNPNQKKMNINQSNNINYNQGKCRIQ